MAQQPRTFNVPQNKKATVPGAYNLYFEEIKEDDIASIATAGPQSAQATLRNWSSFFSAMDRVVSVRSFGAKGDGVTDDAPAINNTIAFVQETWGEGTIIVPPGEYRLNSEIILDSDGLTLLIQAGATLLQYHFGYSFVQIVNADRCTVTGGGRMINPVTKYEIVGSNYNGNPIRTRAAGVYMINANYCEVSNIGIYNSVIGIFGCEAIADRLTTLSFGNKISNIYLEHFDFGILMNSQQNLQINSINSYWTDRSQGTVEDDDNGPAPHALYLSGKQDQTLRNQNVIVSNWTDFFNEHSSSFKAKFSQGIIMTNLQSQLSMRGFDLDVQQFRLLAPMVRYPLGQPCLNFNATCQTGEVVNPYVRVTPDLSDYDFWIGHLVIDTNTVLTFLSEPTCSNITVTGGTLSHFHTDNSPQVQLEGRNIRFTDVELNERGFNAFPFNVKEGALNCKIIRPIVNQEAGDRIASLQAGAENTRIEIDPMVLNFTYGPAAISDAGTNTLVTRVDGTFGDRWTPVPTFATPGDFVPTIITADGWWSKQGEWVTVGLILEFTCNAYTTAAGDFRIGDLPFQAVAPTSGGWSFNAGVGQFRNIGGTIDSMGISVATSDALFATLRRSVSAGNGANIAAGDIPASTANVRVEAQITYKTASTP